METSAELGDEVGAVAAVRQVLSCLAPLVGIGEPRRVCLQHGLPVRAPLAALNQAELRGQLVDAARYLLPVGPRRETLDEPADLPRLQPPAIAEEHYRASPRRKRGEEVAGDPGFLELCRPLVRKRAVVGDGMDGLERCGGSPAPSSQFLTGMVGDGRQQVSADLVVAELVLPSFQGAQRAQPSVAIDVLDRIVVERAPKGAADHRPGGAAKLLVEPARSLAPFSGALGRTVGTARSGNRRHRRLSTITTPQG